MDFSSCAIWTGFHKSSHICVQCLVEGKNFFFDLSKLLYSVKILFWEAIEKFNLSTQA